MSLHVLSSETGLDLCEQTPLTQGHNARLTRLKDKSGKRYIAKESTDIDGNMDLEGWMLEKLKEAGLPVPKVYYKSFVIIVMDELPSQSGKNLRFEEQAAQALAKLHINNTASLYGLEKNTLIGPLDQPNTQCKDWLDFFREHRLMHFSKAAHEAGQIDSGLMGQIEKLSGKLDKYIDEPEKPSLIHGDAWAGNILSSGTELSGFIDPAIYYADPEIEIAFVHLMGGMSAKFFQAYNSLVPERPGFGEVRKALYQLYPLLVHTILYGGGYTSQVQQIVNRFA